MVNNEQTAWSERTEILTVEEQGHAVHLRVRAGTDDADIALEVLHGAYYRHARDALAEGSVVVDVGAHIGSFALLAAARGARVLALEPLPENYRLLVENIHLNHFEDQIKALPLAAWSSTCELPIKVADDSTGGSGFFYHKDSVPRVLVRCARLDDLLDAEGVTHCDLIKLDCEGSEFEILRNLREEAWPRISALVLEYHLFPGNSLGELQRILSNHGFLSIAQPLNAPRLGYLLAIRSSEEQLLIPPLSVTLSDTFAMRLPLVGWLWRAIRRRVHNLVLFYVNQLAAAINERQRWTLAYMRLLALQSQQEERSE